MLKRFKEDKRRLRWIVYGILGAMVVAVVLKLLVPAELKTGTYSTYKVDYGTVMKTVEASGVVEAENEVLLNSPTSTTVKKIYHEPGSRVKAGQVILSLDTEPIALDIENLEDQLKIKRNALTKLRLKVKSTKLDLDYNEETKKLQIASIMSEKVDQEKLLEVGGISQAKYEKTKQALVSAEKDLKMTRTKNNIALQQLEADEEGLELQIEIQEKSLQSKQELLSKMSMRSPSDGIVLNITKKEGEKIREGDLLVELSNLSYFKIKGEIEEGNADFLKTGRKVFVLLENEKLSGKVGRVTPVIQNSKLHFEVFIDSSNHPKLISNQKVNLQIVRFQRDSVLRVANGPAFNKAAKQTFYVVRNSKALATEVKTGLKGDNFLMVKEGVYEGDMVITSDVSTLRRAKIIELK